MAQRGTAADTTSDPPDLPALAPSTWLVGQLQESALEDPPWAVEQPKRGYVEMSELAYRVAEQATGDQTIDEIATAVSTALRRPVSAIDVEALIDTVLIPRGVVRGSNGQIHDGDDGTAAAVTVSGGVRRQGRRVPTARPLRRERIVGPKRLEAVAGILMWLFWPPVMLVVVGVGLAMLVWLFGMHGLARGLIQVLAVPVLLPVTLIVTVLGAAVQGIGPMVALYGGGATIQRLRISPRLGQPAFVVDVADDYGLSRWARLTVNVSGVYLQLVVALVLCILGRLLGGEFLFLAVALLTLNMLRLLLPFGRPGADRLLADWLLVQHPLRYAEQAIGRYVPGLAESDHPLPPLKRWGQITIGVYLLASALMLVVVGLVILRTMPTIVATAWAALSAYLLGMAEALGERDAIMFLGSLFNAAILALTSFCLVVALIVVVRELAARVWGWSQETPHRRLPFTIGVALLILLLVVCWVPVLGWGANGAPRSLVGIPYRSLTELSRGTLFDLFGEASGVETSVDQAGGQPGRPPIVTTDIGSGPVEGPPPGQATPSAGSSAAAGASGSAGTTSAAPAAGTPAAKPAQIGAETPGPANAGRGTPETANQSANAPSGPATTGPANAQQGQATTGPGAAQPEEGTAGSGATPAARGTANANGAPAGRATPNAAAPAAQATADSGPGPASKPTTGAAEQPASKPMSGVVVQPVNKPTAGSAGQPSTKPATGSAGQPSSKPSTRATRAPTSAQDADESEDALDVTPAPMQP